MAKPLTRLEQLEDRVKILEESLNKMQVCATVIKEITQKISGVNIDEKMQEKMKEESKN
jgi:hypothetical protein